jgi:hypothetical protein
MAMSPHSRIAVDEVRRNIKNPNKQYSKTRGFEVHVEEVR